MPRVRSTETYRRQSADGQGSGKPILGVLAGQPATASGESVGLCSDVIVNGSPATDIRLKMPSSSQVLRFTTEDDATLDFVRDGDEGASEQIRLIGTTPELTGTIRASRREAEQISGRSEFIQRGTIREIAGQKNWIRFGDSGRDFSFHDRDIVVLSPVDQKFQIREVQMTEAGLRASMGGTLRDAQSGPGEGTLESRLPTLFQVLDARSRIFGAVPAVAAALSRSRETTTRTIEVSRALAVIAACLAASAMLTAQHPFLDLSDEALQQSMSGRCR